jgi:SAM-dependent methyltransferase
MIELPSEALPFLRQQRTEYKSSTADEAKAGFASDVAQFADQIAPYLPPSEPRMRFVDIGCGIGFALLGLARVFGPDNRFVAIDRAAVTPPTEAGTVPYGFSETPSAYNSLQVTRDILVAAGIRAEDIECVDIDTQPFPRGPANVVTSTFAWGFHFPLQTYLDEVEAALVRNGILIIDVRRGQGQEAILQSRFDLIESWPGPKGRSNRVVLRKR